MSHLRRRLSLRLALTALAALVVSPLLVAAPAQAATTPLGVNGQLHVCGTNLCNQNNQQIQLRGMSSHGLQWFSSCLNNASLDVLATEWKSDLLRIPMYVQEGGYETNPTGFTNQVNSLVDMATARGMYAMIDFHTLTPGDPNYNLERAKTFFASVAARNKDNPGVIYEIANEPNGVSWSQIKQYADQIIPVIRAHDPDAVIIVGTMGWSSLGVSGGGTYQDIVNNKIADPNVMYAFHFYAASHLDSYRQTVASAATVLPLFVTEFGTVTYTGNGTYDEASTKAWIDLLDSKKIGYANWTYSDANESSAAFKPGTCSAGGYSGTANLTPSGSYMRSRIMTPDSFGGATTDTTAPSVPTNLTSPAKTSTSVSLSWTASTDTGGSGLAGYNVYRGTTLVGSPTTTTYTATGLTASTAYSFTVRAKDGAGNLSATSTARSVTTNAAPAAGVKVQYKNNDSSATDNAIKPAIQVVNTSTATVDLTTVSARYYFTRDGGASTYAAFCDYAQAGCGNLQLTVANLATPVNGADAYLEVTFAAGSLPAGTNTGQIQLRLHKSDWSNFNEVGDYSRTTATTYTDNTKITAYRGTTLTWGTPPA